MKLGILFCTWGFEYGDRSLVVIFNSIIYNWIEELEKE